MRYHWLEKVQEVKLKNDGCKVWCFLWHKTASTALERVESCKCLATERTLDALSRGEFQKEQSRTADKSLNASDIVWKKNFLNDLREQVLSNACDFFFLDSKMFQSELDSLFQQSGARRWSNPLENRQGGRTRLSFCRTLMIMSYRSHFWD